MTAVLRRYPLKDTVLDTVPQVPIVYKFAHFKPMKRARVLLHPVSGNPFVPGPELDTATTFHKFFF
jgi:hypothetical protein